MAAMSAIRLFSWRGGGGMRNGPGDGQASLAAGTAPDQPGRDCPLCPRLAAFRADNRAKFPDFHNAPVASFGPLDALVLVVGLAPGLRGANRTARPFTGDYAGDLLYATLTAFGLAEGRYQARPDDGLVLTGCRITNAVRCVPPENKPKGEEIRSCRPFLEAELAALPGLVAVLALGSVAHGALHELPDGLILADSYHCSRYNTNTGRLTEAMFRAVFERLCDVLAA